MIEWDELSPAERLLLTKAAETSPLAFTSLWFQVTQGARFKVNWHHRYYDKVARDVLACKARNVVINVAPGSTKTEFWSVHLPAHAMATHDRVRILNTSYSKDLVEENGARTRDLMASAEFASVYAYQLDKSRADDFTLNLNGKRKHQLYGRSSGGQITGVRGGYMQVGYSGHILADDWDKIDDLFSETRRKRYHTRIVNVLRSRRMLPSTPFLFCQQRGHVDDSSAFLLSGGAGVKVDTHITIPALIDRAYIDTLPPDIAERCKRAVCDTQDVGGYWSYWPEKESVEDLLALREAHPYTFHSQYQQAPESLTGGLFSADGFDYYGNPDEGADVPAPDRIEYRFITADTAQKQNNWNDWTVFAEWGVADGYLYRLAYYRGRPTAPELRRDFEAFVRAAHQRNGGRNGNLRAVLVEDKSSGTGLIQELKGRLPLPVTPIPRNRDKASRALDCQPHYNERRVRLPYGDPDNLEFTAEHGKFRADMSHKWDDQVDATMDAVEYVYITPHTKRKKRAGAW